jgi:hypothetical protein
VHLRLAMGDLGVIAAGHHDDDVGGEGGEHPPGLLLGVLTGESEYVLAAGEADELRRPVSRDELVAIGAGQIVAVDAAAYFSRPGPRIIEGLETLAHIIHPELFPRSPTPVLAVEL